MNTTEESLRDDGALAKSLMSKESSIEHQKKKNRHLHRYRSAFFKPLYEIFICYGHEEFFDCKEAGEDYLNYASIIENINRKKGHAGS